MTVKELAAKLLELPDQEAEVLAFDPDADDCVPVTGMLYGGEHKAVLLQTDDIND